MQYLLNQMKILYVVTISNEVRKADRYVVEKVLCHDYLFIVFYGRTFLLIFHS